MIRGIHIEKASGCQLYWRQLTCLGNMGGEVNPVSMQIVRVKVGPMLSKCKQHRATINHTIKHLVTCSVKAV